MNIVNDEYNNLKLKFYNIESESKKKTSQNDFRRIRTNEGRGSLTNCRF